MNGSKRTLLTAGATPAKEGTPDTNGTSETGTTPAPVPTTVYRRRPSPSWDSPPSRHDANPWLDAIRSDLAD